MKYVIAILLLVSVSGCVGITGGRISGRKHGFEVVGTLPEAFRHRQLGYVDAYVMYKKLMA